MTDSFVEQIVTYIILRRARRKMPTNFDSLSGTEFERYIGQVLIQCGYKHVSMTKASGDQGVDLLAVKDGVRYAFQCKRYAKKVGNRAVQEVYTGMAYYQCQVGVVVTNNYFTDSAIALAQRTGVQLWDRNNLIYLLCQIADNSDWASEEDSDLYLGPQKDKTSTLLLAIFLGLFGGHRFYVGKVGTGTIWLLTGGLLGFGWIVDIILIALDKFTDEYDRPLSKQNKFSEDQKQKIFIGALIVIICVILSLTT